MRKLVLLMLVLGMASMATAGLTFATGSATINVGDSVAVDVLADAANAGLNTTVDYVGNLLDAGVSMAVPVAGSAVQAAGIVDQTAAGYAGYYMLNMGTTTAGGYVVGDQIATITLTGLAAGTYEFYTYDPVGWSTTYVPTDTFTLTVDVPEPITMGILGLGGLFLRRRK